MRSQIVKNNSNTIILDAYNANPSSMHEALDAFAQMQFESKWIILGEMAELGAYKKSEHQLLVDKISKFNFDQVILIGDQFYDLHQISEVKLFRTVAECQAWLQYQWPENAGILIKGSRSAKLETLMN
jgi:UDP-N-acetylmuramoyl-tripeptide--D-alanyl-D-alanine ligase